MSQTIIPQQMKLSRFWLIIGWIICGIGMFGVIRSTPLTRTQEARVVVSAREMIGQPLAHWLIPTANGEARLRKPPLAYWLSAISYQVFGYSVTAARIPALISAWLTVGFTFLIAKKLFSPRAGFYSAVCLMGSWFFLRFGLFAETDVLVMCQMTAGVYFLLRARDSANPSGWLSLISLMIGLILLTKGPPAICLLLLIVLTDWFEGRFRKSSGRPVLSKLFFTRGIFLITVAIALPWFAYALSHTDGSQLTDDLGNSAMGGKGHAGMFWVYLPMLAQAFVPWTIVWAISGITLLFMIFRRTLTQSLIFLILWGSVILVPLMLWGNKQPHYLLCYVPAGAIAVGWMINQCNRIDLTEISGWTRKLVGAWLVAVVALCWLAVFLIPSVGNRMIGRPLKIDLQAAVVMGVLLLLTLVAGRVKQWKLPEISVISVLVMMLVLQTIWLPSLVQNSPAMIADKLQRQFPDAEIVFRQSASLPLCAELKRVIPVWNDDQLIGSIDDNLIVIGTTKESQTPLAGYQIIYTFHKGENPIDLFAHDRSKWAELHLEHDQP